MHRVTKMMFAVNDPGLYDALVLFFDITVEMEDRSPGELVWPSMVLGYRSFDIELTMFDIADTLVLAR